jgi:hypothetical protein
MALFHRATLIPTKIELIASWAPQQDWGPSSDGLDVVGAFRFDDPDGRVGMETHLVTADGVLYQVPLTYRDAPLDGADDALVGRMEHSALGTRWVYDGVRDPAYVVMLAGVAMTGQGEALGMVVYEDRWYIAPSPVRIEGGGWTDERVAVDRFAVERDDATGTTLRNDRFRLDIFRRPTPRPRPAIGLTARGGGLDEPVVLASVTDLGAPAR